MQAWSDLHHVFDFRGRDCLFAHRSWFGFRCDGPLQRDLEEPVLKEFRPVFPPLFYGRAVVSALPFFRSNYCYYNDILTQRKSGTRQQPAHRKVPLISHGPVSYEIMWTGIAPISPLESAALEVGTPGLRLEAFRHTCFGRLAFRFW